MGQAAHVEGNGLTTFHYHPPLSILGPQFSPPNLLSTHHSSLWFYISLPTTLLAIICTLLASPPITSSHGFYPYHSTPTRPSSANQLLLAWIHLTLVRPCPTPSSSLFLPAIFLLLHQSEELSQHKPLLIHVFQS